MGDIEDTTEARGPLMPNLRPKPSLHPKLMLKLHHGVDTTVDTDTPVPTDMDTTATDTARGPLMPNLRLKPSPHPKLAEAAPWGGYYRGYGYGYPRAYGYGYYGHRYGKRSADAEPEAEAEAAPWGGYYRGYGGYYGGYRGYGYGRGYGYWG